MNEKEHWSRMETDIETIIEAHGSNARSPSKAHRKWDCQTPYAIHPLWCATTLSTETTLDEQTRTDGFLALLYHDVLEDTAAELPIRLSARVRALIDGMTFHGGSTEEETKLWSRPKEIRLYKLYDKTSNLLDGSWMRAERKKRYKAHTRRILDDVLANYGELNITRIAKTVVGFYEEKVAFYNNQLRLSRDSNNRLRDRFRHQMIEYHPPRNDGGYEE